MATIHFYRRSLSVLLLVLSSATAGMVHADVPDIRDVVGAFLKAEAEGDDFDRRVKLVKLSAKRQAELEKKTDVSAYVFEIQYHPLFVIAGYKLMSVDIRNHRATAIVAYKRLARTKGENIQREIIPEYVDNEKVTLNLVFDKNQWWVLDPPPPRVSKEVLIRYYEAETKWYIERQNEFGKLPKFQQDAYDKKSATLRLLKSL